MTQAQAVSTIFTAVDRVSPLFEHIQKKSGTMASAVKKAFTSQLGTVALGNLMARGVETGMRKITQLVTVLPELALKADAIGKQAQILGVTTDALQRYRYAADMSGVSSQALSTSMGFFNKTLAGGGLVKSLEKIDKGLAGAMSKATDFDSAMKIMAKAQANGLGGDKLYGAMAAAFGKQGARMIPMLAGLDVSLKDADVFGKMMPPETIALATRFNDALTNVKNAFATIGVVILNKVMPSLTSFMEGLQDKMKVFIEETLPEIIKKIQKVWDFIKEVIANVWPIFKTVIGIVSGAIMGLLDNITLLWPVIVMATGAIILFKGAMAIGEVIHGAMVAFGLLKASIIAQGLPVNALTLAHAALTAAMMANPLAVILTGLIALVLGIAAIVKYATGDVMTWGESIIVVLQNINRAIGTVLNPIFDIIQEILTFPKRFGLKASQARSVEMDALQDRINLMTTGTTNRFSEHYGLHDFGGGDILKLAKERAESGGADNKTEMLDEIKKILEELKNNTAAVDGLGGSPSSSNPGQLNYSQMGIGDVWDVALRG
jgi:hypothetical protein